MKTLADKILRMSAHAKADNKLIFVVWCTSGGSVHGVAGEVEEATEHYVSFLPGAYNVLGEPKDGRCPKESVPNPFHYVIKMSSVESIEYILPPIVALRNVK